MTEPKSPIPPELVEKFLDALSALRDDGHQMARAGTRHGVLASPTGCVLLLRSPSPAGRS